MPPLQNSKLENIKWPTQSPDLDSLKPIWDKLDRRVKAKQPAGVSIIIYTGFLHIDVIIDKYFYTKDIYQN